MRQILFLMSFVLIQSSFSASFTSVMNGNWSSPLTWGEVAIIPQPGDDVTINHTVTLDDQFTVAGYWSVNGGSISIGVSGVLQAGANVLGIAIQNNGTIVNDGQFNMPQLGNYSGSFTNNGSSSLNQLIYNADYFENNGDITDLDSVLTIGEFYNNTSADFYTDSIWIEGVFSNNGNMYLHEITNNGDFTNDSYIEFRRLTNLGDFVNNGNINGEIDMTNAGNFSISSTGLLEIGNNFLNMDSVAHNAVFIVEGIMNVNNNFYNADTIKGIDGDINVQDSSFNSGWFKQSFNFCDATPMVSQSPFVDFNTGTIEGTVRFCNENQIESLEEPNLVFYPNPANNDLYVNGLNSKVQIFDFSGRLCLNVIQLNQKYIDVSALKPGGYIIRIETKEGKFDYPLIIE